MSRPALIAITCLFVLAGLAVSWIGGAQARSAQDPSVWAQTTNAMPTPVERCALQPHRVSHPQTGARILVLRPDC